MKTLLLAALLLTSGFAQAEVCAPLRDMLRNHSYDLSTVKNTYECNGNALQEDTHQPSPVSICLATAKKQQSDELRFVVWQNDDATGSTMSSRLGAFYSRSGDELGRPYYYEVRTSGDEVLFQASWYVANDDLKIRTVSFDKSSNLFRSVSVLIENGSEAKQETDRVELSCKPVILGF